MPSGFECGIFIVRNYDFNFKSSYIGKPKRSKSKKKMQKKSKKGNR